jgi:hypothetical protein
MRFLSSTVRDWGAWPAAVLRPPATINPATELSRYLHEQTRPVIMVGLPAEIHWRATRRIPLARRQPVTIGLLINLPSVTIVLPVVTRLPASALATAFTGKTAAFNWIDLA